MKLSTKGRYGLRAMLDLAEHEEFGAVSIASIAERQNLSESYLEQLIRRLRDAGLVKSLRGAGGGYILERSAARISVGDVLRALEGDLAAVSCTGDGDEPCGNADSCISRIVWEKINRAIEDTVNGIYLSDLLTEGKKKQDGANNTEIACESGFVCDTK